MKVQIAGTHNEEWSYKYTHTQVSNVSVICHTLKGLVIHSPIRVAMKWYMYNTIFDVKTFIHCVCLWNFVLSFPHE